MCHLNTTPLCDLFPPQSDTKGDFPVVVWFHLICKFSPFGMLLTHKILLVCLANAKSRSMTGKNKPTRRNEKNKK